MDGKYVLDSDIVIDYFDGDSKVVNKIREKPKIFLPIIVIGELYLGAILSKKKEANLNRISDFCNKSEILDCTIETAEFYAGIKKDLRLQGTPIPDNDIWIAAISRQYNIELVSRDEHFKYVENLKWIKW